MQTNTRRGLCFTTLLVSFVLGQAVFAKTEPKSKPVTVARSLRSLRCSDEFLLDMLDRGLSQSATLRDLESHLERSQVIVYMARSVLPTGLVGKTTLIGAGNGWRYLSLRVDSRVEPVDVLTVLGHELQHVVEIADAKEVVDQASLAALYRRIGVSSSGADIGSLAFETAEALAMGRRVHADMAGRG
jgi:hypothetical protein